MANHDHLNPKTVSALGGTHYVITYTNLQPELLPANIQKPIEDGNLRSFAVGACFAQSPSYPGWTYWVAVAFYYTTSSCRSPERVGMDQESGVSSRFTTPLHARFCA